MKVRYCLRKDTVAFGLTEVTTYGIDAFAENGGLAMSIIDISLNCNAVIQLIENLNKYRVELVHLMDVVYDFYCDSC